MIINAGQLNKQLILQAPSISREADGAEVITWTTLATIWSDITSSGGREFWQAKQINAEISHMVTIRYRDKISPRYRLLYGSRIFQILSVVNADETRTGLQLMCKEVLA